LKGAMERGYGKRLWKEAIERGYGKRLWKYGRVGYADFCGIRLTATEEVRPPDSVPA